MAPMFRKRKRAGSYSKGRPAKRYKKSFGKRSSNNFVTHAYDVTTQYRKKSMKKYKKRQWRKFTRKVTAVQLKNAGLKTIVFNDKITQSTSPGYQGHMWLGLYGNNGTDDGGSAGSVLGWKDLNKIFINDPDIAKQGTAPNQTLVGGKLTFGSGVLDVTIRNVAEQDAEVDVYYVVFRKDQDQQAPATDNPRDSFGNQPLIINSGNGIVNLEERGCTLFDMSESLSKTGLKVLSKQKYVMTPGRSVFIQHRDPQNHSIDANAIKNYGYALRKYTYGICIVHKPSVAVSDNLVSTLAVGCTRKYSYTALEENADCASKI